MKDFSKRIAALSPEQRALLQARLKKMGLTSLNTQVIPRRGESDSLPLSFAQERLWFLDQLEPGMTTYNRYPAVRLSGSLDTALLERSLNEIVRRHEALRTSFTAIDGRPIQVIAPSLTVPLTQVDLREFPSPEREAIAQRLAIEEIQRPFDLASAPLVRATLLLLDEEEYMLLLVLHHIISDGWSDGILFRELAILYEAFISGKPSPLPELPIQYADFACWQRDWLQREVLEAQLTYWKQQLGGNLPVLELPADRLRPAVQIFRGAKQGLVLSKSLTESIKVLSRQEETTLFMMLLAAFQALLYRYTGQEDLLVGTTHANRNRSEIENLIGFFVNTLVLRTDVSGNPSFRELLRRVREVAIGAYAHQDLPFEKLVKELAPKRDLSHTPLFQVMFALQNAPMPLIALPGLTLRSQELAPGTTPFDLMLSMVETEQGLRGTLEYNTDLFEKKTISRMVEHYQTLLGGIASNPERRLSDLPVLAEAELQQLVVEWNATEMEYPRDQCIHELFEAQVERMPEAIAVAFEGKQLTYRELNRRANQLAHYLQKLGVGPDTLVGFCMERSLEMVIGLLGALKAGAGYVPLDPAYPKERLTFMLEDAQVVALLTQQRLVEKLPPHDGMRNIYLDVDIFSQEPDHNPSSGVTPDNLAYVIYTSGSTGKPKGIAMRYGHLSNLISWQLKNSSLPGDARTLQYASLNFDISLQESFLVWCSGGTLVLISEDVRRDPEALLRYLADERIERLFLPFVALQQLAEVADERESVPCHLREVFTAGEQLQVTPHLKRLFSRLQGCTLHNQYGPSECHVVTSFTLPASPSDWPALPPIGRPIANTQIYVLDAHLQPVPVGVPGEVYIGGVTLARGYLNHPELTAERLIPDPFSGKPGMRLYKTGDLARYLADGNIEFLGRFDHQVKIRGFRIELGEIEAVLLQHPAVREALVMAREDVPGNKLLTTYLVLDDGQAVTVGNLRSFLQEKLPEYMVPSAFVILDALPLDLNKKVDRHRLPVPSRFRPELEGSFVAPRTPLEAALANVWAEVLGVERVGVEDNFFELGGHSLLTTQLMARVRKAFRADLPLRSFFATPTVAGMAHALDALLQRAASPGQETSGVVDLNAEAVLDHAIRLQAEPVAQGFEPRCIFLTGATGFLGAFLLHELLGQTQADIYCLVHCPTVEEGVKKLQRNLQAYSLWHDGLLSRVVPVVGDLSRPLLGLPVEQFHVLADRIDAIYHNGAFVNYMYPYTALKPVNVLGTQEVLRLASQTRTKPVQYVSTIAVFSSEDNAKRAVIREDDDLGDSVDHELGYVQSKWVAEKLVRIARDRGLPVCIFRPGRIAGHSRTGACQTDDFLWRMLKACVQISKMPVLDMTVDISPVDYVSQAIVHISRQSGALGGNFHLLNPHPIHLSEIGEWMRTFGYPLELVPYDTWRTELIKATERSANNAAHPLVSLFFDSTPQEQMPAQTDGPRFECKNTLDGLAGTSIVCPPIDARLLGTYLSYFIQSGFLEAPPEGARMRQP